MASTWSWYQSAMAASAVATITPPVGRIWALDEFSSNSSEYLTFPDGSYSGGNSSKLGAPSIIRKKTAILFDSTTPATVQNSNSSSMYIYLGGDEFDPTQAGIIELSRSLTSSDQVRLGKISDTSSVWQIQCMSSQTGEWRFVDNSSGTYLSTLFKGGTSSGNASNTTGLRHIFLWPELNLDILHATTYPSVIRLVRWDASSLPEYNNRLAIRDVIPAQGTYDLRPPVGEVWFIDYYTDISTTTSGLHIYQNGTTEMSYIASPATLRVSYDNWMQLRNQNSSGGASVQLVVSGVKGAEMP
jgi:hypothetical protein